MTKVLEPIAAEGKSEVPELNDQKRQRFFSLMMTEPMSKRMTACCHCFLLLLLLPLLLKSERDGGWRDVEVGPGGERLGSTRVVSGGAGVNERRSWTSTRYNECVVLIESFGEKGAEGR